MAEICFITTCKGRLAHLMQTLPAAAAQPWASWVVVDYSCPQDCGAWVQQQFTAMKVVRVPDQQRFRAAHARNHGAAAADSPWLCFFDADVVLAPQFVNVVAPLLLAGCYYRPQPYQKETCGTCICHQDDFRRAGGYDEVIQGWGCEDTDVYQRLELLGVTEQGFPADLVQHLGHGDDMRTEYYEIKETMVSHTINWIYCQAKLDVMRLTGTALSLAIRQQLYADVGRAVAVWRAGRRPSQLRVSFRPRATWYGAEFTQTLNYTLGPLSDQHDRPA